jgi:methyl-accepting chemotaxis protein
VSSQEKSIRFFFLVSILGLAVAFALGFGQQKTDRPMMGMMDHMDGMSGQSNQLMGQIDAMMDETCPTAKSMMEMKSMMVRMGSVSQSMRAMMDNLHSMMMDDGLMGDKAMTDQSQQMQDNVHQMAEGMQKAMENMRAMTQRMKDLQKKG